MSQAYALSVKAPSGGNRIREGKKKLGIVRASLFDGRMKDMQYDVNVNGKIIKMRRQEMMDLIRDMLTCNIYDDDMPAIIEFMGKYWHPDPLSAAYEEECEAVSQHIADQLR